MIYFSSTPFLSTKKNLLQRQLLQNVKSLFAITVGDIISLSFKKGGYDCFFQGVCIALRKKSLSSPDSSIILRNVLSTVPVELTLSLYQNLCLDIKIDFYRRKQDVIFHSKLFGIRNKMNKLSRV